ncbi:MAG: flagellar basal body L-ring protein FlgH [Thalassobaculales bacterium]
MRAARPLAALALMLALPACNTIDRLSNVGKQPTLSRIENPTQVAGYVPISMPMPAPVTAERKPNSLWQSGARAFFKDQRAKNVGDLITVTINIDDRASVSNSSSRTRETTENVAVPGLLGFQNRLRNILPNDVDPSQLLDITGETENTGTGSIARQDQIRLRIAAVVSQILPNGNMVITGRQEVKVNFEVRELVVAGVIRPEDIDATNTIPYDRLAEARISYGGRGQIMDVQQPRYGNQLLDIIMPF